MECRALTQFSFVLIYGWRQYATGGALAAPGPLLLRPWMLNFKPNMGLKGFLEPARGLVKFTFEVAPVARMC